MIAMNVMAKVFIVELEARKIPAEVAVAVGSGGDVHFVAIF